MSGSDKSGRSEKSVAVIREAVVTEILPSAGYRLKLKGGEVVTAHAAGASQANFLRLRAGDRVRVELAERDRTRGRILELLGI